MKKSYLVSLMVCLCAILSAVGQTTQKGYVKEYKETLKKQPLGGVEMLITNAPSTVSDKKGGFALEFQTMKPGQKVNVRRIEKLGYEIFNKEALEQWNINPDEPFTIIMVRSDRFKKIRDNYSAVSSASYARQFEKDMKALEEERKAGKLTEEQLRAEIVCLQEEYDRQLYNLDNYIDRFARIDLNELSTNEQEIITLIQTGEIDKAIVKYEELNLVHKYEQLSKEKDEIELAKVKLDKKLMQNSNATKEVWLQLKRQIDAYLLQGGIDNYDKILSIVECVVQTASPVEQKLGLVYALKNKDAINVYESCDFSELNSINFELLVRGGYGIALLLDGRTDDAQAQAELLIKRAEEHNDVQYIIVGKTLLADAYSNKFQDDEAGKVYAELLEQIETSEHNIGLEQQAGIYSRSTGYYQNINLELFYKYACKSYEMYKQLYESDPTLRTESQYINASVQLGIAMRVIEDYDGCIKTLQGVLPRIKKIKEQPFLHLEVLFEISAYKTLAECHFFKQQYDDSEQMFLYAINLMEQNRVFISDFEVVSLYNNLGFFYYSVEKYDKSEQAYLKSLENAKLVGDEVTFLSLNAIFRPQINIAVLYLELMNYEQAKYYGYLGLKNCEILYHNYPQFFAYEYNLILKTLAKTELNVGQYSSSLEFVEKALAVNAQDAESIDLRKMILHQMDQSDK